MTGKSLTMLAVGDVILEKPEGGRYFPGSHQHTIDKGRTIFINRGQVK